MVTQRRRFLFTLLFVLPFCGLLQAQTASDCTVPLPLRQAYARDVINLSMTLLESTQSPDTARVHVPRATSDPIFAGLAAIYQAASFPERDSIFELYCVHDVTSPIQTYSGYLIHVDTNYAWTQAWQNLTTLTGNAPLDAMLTQYDLHIDQYFSWSIGEYALLSSDSLWNSHALIDSLENIAGIIYGEPDQIIGMAGKIRYREIGNDRYYDFYFEFNDCFDGCDNYHVWHYKVMPDCSVAYLGYDDWGFFQIEPLPAPLNCNLATALQGPQPLDYQFQAFPNPATDVLNIVAPQGYVDAFSVAVFDGMGRKWMVIDQVVERSQLDLSSLATGIYSVVILEKGKVLQSMRIAHR